jgi:hypothetical protein
MNPDPSELFSNLCSNLVSEKSTYTLHACPRTTPALSRDDDDAKAELDYGGDFFSLSLSMVPVGGGWVLGSRLHASMAKGVVFLYAQESWLDPLNSHEVCPRISHLA